MLEVHQGTEYKDFISLICQKRETKTYLEIGVQSGFNLSGVKAADAIGVDPSFKLKTDVTQGKERVHLFRMTSDVFFKENKVFVRQLGGSEFTFLDGMHLFEFLLRDFYNAEACAAPNGVIAMHDCMPFDGGMIERLYRPDLRPEGPFRTFWTGDVWKIVPILRKYRPDLRIQLVNCNPTGLVCVSNLNPSCGILKDNYYEIIKEFLALPNNMHELEKLYLENRTTKAGEILAGDDHTLFFNC